MAQTNEPSGFDALQDTLAMRLPEGRRYAEDTIWSEVDVAALMPRLAEHLVQAPSPRSLFMTTMHPFGSTRTGLSDGAFSMTATTFVLGYAIWDDHSDDVPNQTWLRQAMSAIEPHAVGHYIAETDLTASTTKASRAFSPESWTRLRALRRQLDPDGLFHTILDPEASQ